MTEYLRPAKIIKCENVQNIENLLQKQDLQISINEDPATVFEKGGYVILDFGKELCGGIRILTCFAGDPRPPFFTNTSKVRVRFGESLTECCSDLGGEKNATNDHALRDFESYLPSLSDITLGDSGFRFVRLDFFDRIKIRTIVAENKILKKKAIFEYNGQDKLIKQIYVAAKRTVDLCASSGYVWDGVKRDRLVWIGDMHPETLALTTLYGSVKELENSLDFVRKQTPLPNWMNGFPMYSMWWIIILADYYAATGKKGFINRQLDYLQGLVAQMNNCVSASGEMNYPFYFVDWPTHGKPDESDGARAINIYAANKAITLLNEFGIDTAGAELLRKKLLKVEIKPKTSKQVTGLKYMATGKLTEEDKARLVAGGARGMSTFMSYYILKAVASFDKEAAVSMMKEYYGAMLDKGATTFFEDFDMEWAENACRIDEFPQENQRDIHGDFGAHCYIGFRHSLCHGWSAGVLQFIKEECN